MLTSLTSVTQKANSISQYSHCTILFGHSDVVCSCRSLFCIFPSQSSQVMSSYWHSTKCSCKRKKEHFRVLWSQCHGSCLFPFCILILERETVSLKEGRSKMLFLTVPVIGKEIWCDICRRNLARCF